MNRRRVQLTIVIVITFLTGTLFGGWATRQRLWHRWDPQKRQQQMLETFSKKLTLTPEQRVQVASILETGHLKMQSLHDQVRPQFEALRVETSQQIRALLTPRQIEKFNAVEAEFTTRRERFHKRWEGNTK